MTEKATESVACPEDPRAKATSLRLGPTRIADQLNERFLTLVRLLDTMARKGEQALVRTLTRCRAPVHPEAQPTPPRDTDDPAKRARDRLSELHLCVGQAIYQLETQEIEPGAVQKQLWALLDEIERLEEVLRGVVEGHQDASKDAASKEE